MNRYLSFLFGLSSLFGVSQSNIQSLGELPQEVLETSGLIYYNNRLITHNDSGNVPELYELDVQTLQIVRTIRVLNEGNVDWEDLTQDSDFIYIGDIGNNQGSRQDLAVLRISKTEFDTSDEVNAERISFMYGDQTDFTPVSESDFDAEALFVLDDDLILLTKEWRSEGTVAYKIPKAPGTYSAQRMDSYQINGLVTGASFDVLSNTLYLVGYSKILIPFFVEVPNVNANAIFSGGALRSGLAIGPAQIEALTFTNDIFYATSEEFINPPLSSSSRLFRFSLDSEENPIPVPSGEPPSMEELVVFKSLNSLEVNYELNSNKPIYGMGIFDSMGRMISYTPLEQITANPIDISTFSQGLYHLAFFYGNTAISAPFFKD